MQLFLSLYFQLLFLNSFYHVSASNQNDSPDSLSSELSLTNPSTSQNMTVSTSTSNNLNEASALTDSKRLIEHKKCILCEKYLLVENLIKFCGTVGCEADNLCKSCFITYIKKRLSIFEACISPVCRKQLSEFELFGKLLKITQPNIDSKFTKLNCENWPFVDLPDKFLIDYIQSDKFISQHFSSSEMYKTFRFVFELKYILCELYTNGKIINIKLPFLIEICINDDEETLTINGISVQTIKDLYDFVYEEKISSIETNIANTMYSVFLNLISSFNIDNINLNISSSSLEFINNTPDYDEKTIPISAGHIFLKYNEQNISSLSHFLSMIRFGKVNNLNFLPKRYNYSRRPQFQPPVSENKSISFDKLRKVTIFDEKLLNIYKILQIISNIKTSNIFELSLYSEDIKLTTHELEKNINLCNTHIFRELIDLKTFNRFFSIFWSIVEKCFGLTLFYNHKTHLNETYRLTEDFNFEHLEIKVSMVNYKDNLPKIIINNGHIKELHLYQFKGDLFKLIEIHSQALKILQLEDCIKKNVPDICNFLRQLNVLEQLSIINNDRFIDIYSEHNNFDKLKSIKNLTFLTYTGIYREHNIASFFNNIYSMKTFYYTPTKEFIGLSELQSLQTINLEILIIDIISERHCFMNVFGSTMFKTPNIIMPHIDRDKIKHLKNNNSKLRKIIICGKNDEQLKLQNIRLKATKPDYFDQLNMENYIEMKYIDEEIYLYIEKGVIRLLTIAE